MYTPLQTSTRTSNISVHLTASTTSSADVAASIVGSTTSLGVAYRHCFADAHPLSLFGGRAPRRKIVTIDEIRGCVGPEGLPPVLEHAEYVLEDYVPLHLYNRDGDRHRGCIVVRLPYYKILPLFGVEELRDLCSLHNLPVTKLHLRASLEATLSSHMCIEEDPVTGDVGCEVSYAVLKPRIDAPGKAYAGLLDLESEAFTAACKTIPLEDVRTLLNDDVAAMTSVGFNVKAVRRSGTVNLTGGQVLLSNIPHTVLAKRLNVQAIRSLASHHGVNIPVRWKKDKCIDALTRHRCDGCRTLHYILEPVCKPTKKKSSLNWLDEHDADAPFMWESTFTLPSESYPPRPTTMCDMARSMKGYCADLTPEVLEESGCCVCAQLVPLKSMIPFDKGKYDLSLLEEDDCTRVERINLDEPQRQLEGPVIDPALDNICLSCNDSLSQGHRPKTALANRLWLGKVPSCLKELTLAEMAMVTRVRYSRCVVRVSKGHAKMVANVIAFEHPSKKIYERLPMPRDELSDVLSVLFNGAAPPTDDDLRRTPVLVRKAKVQSALEWLKVNHADYQDLAIDYATLDSDYPLDGIPVGVLHNLTNEGDGNVPAAAKSVFDTDPEVGTTEGPCPFSVNGLTAERFSTMTTTERKLTAMRYLKNGGSSLAVGHDSIPQSLWSNPRLYPQMFPWLFPYGMGGVGQDSHFGCLSRDNHIKWLLMYYDKRFQEDAGFLIVMFNHQLMRQSSKGSYISMKRSNFGRMADAIEKLDPLVLQSISERLVDGGRFVPQNPEEQRCARLCDQVEVVGSHVDGSLAKKKYQRSEIWSLISFMNTPAWFITFSPADAKHPLCIYLASHNTEFKPTIAPYAERLHKISRNPVACARFFDYLVRLFLKHICGWTDDGPIRGIFGTPSAFYGMVEQQGRMTLHLHLLLWIRGQLPFNVVRDRIMAEDSAFIQELTEYIESCMIGEFMTGSRDEVAARVPYVPDNEDRGIHTILVDTSNVPDGYVDPTLTLPEAPPDDFCEEPESCRCENCRNLLSWWERTKFTVDDILFRSNIHTCFGRKDNKKSVKGKGNQHEGSKFIPKFHATGKGCINKDGICTARFPRPIFWSSKIDVKSGHIDPKKQEPQLNDVNPVVCACTRCNTDLRCLLSGTAVKAVVGYVTDYISKGWLKTHQVFSTMYDAFKRNEDVLDKSQDQKVGNGARRMIMKVVNSLSSKMEIGAPMAALYLLQNPDHYTSHQFVNFYWKNYTNYVQNQWSLLLDHSEPADDDVNAAPVDVGITRLPSPEALAELHNTTTTVSEELGVDLHDVVGQPVKCNAEDHHDDALFFSLDAVESQDLLTSKTACQTEGSERDDMDLTPTLVDGAGGPTPEATRSNSDDFDDIVEPVAGDETIRVTRSKGFYLANSNTDDYRYRPEKFEDVGLYEFVQCSLKHPIRSSRNPRSDLPWYRFADAHPQSESHAMALDPERRHAVVPNFIGPTLPRKDVGDKDEYCCAMLTLFSPWRTGIDLKSADESWEDRFLNHNFTDRQRDLMANFNMRYECYDARDDYGAVLKAAKSADGVDTCDDEDEDVYADNGENVEDDDEELLGELGTAARALKFANHLLMGALKLAGWKSACSSATAHREMKLPVIAIDNSLRSAAWNNIVRVEKLRAWKRKLGTLGDLPVDRTDDDLSPASQGELRNDAFVVPSSYLSNEYRPSNLEWGRVMDDIICKWKLNSGQEKAFRIIANHGCCVAPEQLLMHLGGMGGTGKSTVIKSLCEFFTARGETFRFVLLGPTGTSAALIGGSTYHTFLGLNTSRGQRGDTASKVEEIRERLTGVGYILLDEVSMLDCRALCAISARCCEALGVFEKPFGGLSVILCGDFAQLPPVTGSPLYSRAVVLRQSARQSIYEQENTIGKLIWLQFTTVVVLTENMRQTTDNPEEEAFRTALTNLRWRSCTEDDRRLIRSRIPSTSNGLSVDGDQYRNVSIITARNMDKDHINAANSAKFAAEHGTRLHEFYSVDTMSNAEPKRTDPRKRNRVYCTAKSITKPMQVALWNQPPSTSEQIPGVLKLCVGMPVIIRYNDATELCMTRGQEARVVGWSAVNVPRHKGRQCLDVLYVELLNPPHTVKLPNLPRNVVPLTRNAQSIEGQLPNDQWVCMSRSQVPVLPNFAMTDYSSQGKTRPWNVIDLAECRTFQAAYTCLSRGTSIAQTIIMRDFPDTLLSGPLDGALRQEYRELDQLTIVTDLQYRGLLPPDIAQATRWETIDKYRQWKRTSGAMVDAAPIMFDDPVLLTDKEYSRPEEPVDLQHNTISSVLKRKATHDGKSVPAKRRKVQPAQPILANESWTSPVGPLWDSADWSCPFDAWTTIFYWTWSGDRVKWSRVLKSRSVFLSQMIEGFEGMAHLDPEAEITEIRNRWREAIQLAYPHDYPSGQRGTDIMTLTRHLLGHRPRHGLRESCPDCTSPIVQSPATPLAPLSVFSAVRDAFSIQDFVDQRLRPYSACSNCQSDIFLHNAFCETLTFEVGLAGGGLLLNSWIEVGDWGLYRLAGVVYWGDYHFISRVIGRNNKVYTHDGVEGGSSVYDGMMGSSFQENQLNTCREKTMSLAFYVLADRITRAAP